MGIKAQPDQALKAANRLLSLIKRMSFDVKSKLKLFNIFFVSPILLYASDAWEIYKCHHIDKIHIKFCKHFIGVGTPNFAVYGDLRRFLPTKVP